MRVFAAISIVLLLLTVSVHAQVACDACAFDATPSCDSMICTCSKASKAKRSRRSNPAMIGDFFRGPSASITGQSVIDRLVVVANDLDAPITLPASGLTLSISEAGPVGIFEDSLGSIQNLQALLRAGSPLPAGALAGTINDLSLIHI